GRGPTGSGMRAARHCPIAAGPLRFHPLSRIGGGRGRGRGASTPYHRVQLNNESKMEGSKAMSEAYKGAAYTGGCACGAIRYEISGEPVSSNHCQCRDCQSESGAGHLSHLTFMREGVAVSGEAAAWEMTADSGNKKSRHFCPTCGSPVYMTFSAMPE